MTTVTAITRPDDRTPMVLQGVLREALARWRSQAMELWRSTAEVGSLLVEAHEQIDAEQWPGWLEAVGLTPVAALVFMRAREYPKLMEQYRPGSVDAIRRLLPTGPGTAMEFEQASLARRLSAAGVSRLELRAQFGCSAATLSRWLDPDGAKRRAKAAASERRERLRKRRDDAEARARASAVKAAGGPAATAFEHLRRAQVALDAAVGETQGDRKRLLSAALSASYEMEDRLAEAARLA